MQAAPVESPPKPGAQPDPSRTVTGLLEAYRDGRTTVTEVAGQVLQRIDDRGKDGTWISVAERGDLLRRAARLDADPGVRDRPLFGIPFAVKDSLDITCLLYTSPSPRDRS